MIVRHLGLLDCSSSPVVCERTSSTHHCEELPGAEIKRRRWISRADERHRKYSYINCPCTVACHTPLSTLNGQSENNQHFNELILVGREVV